MKLLTSMQYASLSSAQPFPTLAWSHLQCVVGRFYSTETWIIDLLEGLETGLGGHPDSLTPVSLVAFWMQDQMPRRINRRRTRLPRGQA